MARCSLFPSVLLSHSKMSFVIIVSSWAGEKRRKRERYRNRFDFYLLRDVSQWAVSRASSLRDRSWLGFLQLVRVRDEKWTDDVIAVYNVRDEEFLSSCARRKYTFECFVILHYTTRFIHRLNQRFDQIRVVNFGTRLLERNKLL